MKFSLLSLILLSLSTLAEANSELVKPNEEQYTATVQLFIQEPTPQLVKRSQKLAVKELKNTFQSRRELELSNFDLKVSPSGNAILLTVASNKDIQIPVQHALSSVITGLDGKVWAQGRGDVFKTSLSQPPEGVIDIELADPPLPEDPNPEVGDVLIKRIFAISAPVRDILRTLKAHIIQDPRLSGITAFGHSMLGSCAAPYIDWVFNESNDEAPRTLDSLMEELAAVLNVPRGVENKGGRYIFKGACPSYQPTYRKRSNLTLGFPGSGVKGSGGKTPFQAITSPVQPVNVEIPLMPLGRW